MGSNESALAFSMASLAETTVGADAPRERCAGGELLCRERGDWSDEDVEGVEGEHIVVEVEFVEFGVCGQVRC